MPRLWLSLPRAEAVLWPRTLPLALLAWESLWALPRSLPRLASVRGNMPRWTCSPAWPHPVQSPGGSRWRVGKNAFKIPIRYVRQDERNWTYAAFHSLEEVVTLSTLGCQLVLKDIYAKVDVSQPSGTV